MENEFMCKLWGKYIVGGSRKYKDVPAYLKDGVREYLYSIGFVCLIESEVEQDG